MRRGDRRRTAARAFVRYFEYDFMIGRTLLLKCIRELYPVRPAVLSDGGQRKVLIPTRITIVPVKKIIHARRCLETGNHATAEQGRVHEHDAAGGHGADEEKRYGECENQ